MIAGLLFAIAELEDEPDRLVATAPFGGVTLIEYQARLLIAAGASQIVIAVGRLTPALLGAVTRIGQRGVAVDAVRSAQEAAEKLHPLARVLMLADGLLTTAAAVEPLALEGADALLVVPEDQAAAGWERLGGRMAWAGAARLDPRRVAEVASLPRDYDLQSTLLRLAEQARAAHLLLPAEVVQHGHGIERRGSALAERGRRVAASLMASRHSWFDRWIVAPIARVVLPPLLDRHTGSALVTGVGTAVGIGGLAAIVAGWWSVGLWLALAGCIAASIAGVLAGLRDEARALRVAEAVEAIVPAAAALLLGWGLRGQGLGDGAPIVAVAGVIAGILAQRSVAERGRRLGWGNPPAYLMIVALFALARWPVAGLVVAALYATLTLALAIERLRRQA